METIWISLHHEYSTWPWFSRVGQSIDHLEMNEQPWRVWNWGDAEFWAVADISWFCAVEASNLLRDALAGYQDQYQRWNQYNEAINQDLDRILETTVVPAIPISLQPRALHWIRALLRGASMELAYADLSPVRQATEVVDWFRRGYFPCGWIAGAETGFPAHSQLLVF
ncbi:hypothetical protein [Tuwongella immobilis]|uniref:Uncharacterized protein n=1 Tax=Tuwongella immobilis TaxID=692036 RepID=A0A6C2YMP6_9BACT|nr:hypothetical protein [Tuwongella immobilis]VIP02192.1 unnamed protein product [Tuwongella immobilis]VTS00663.1 unnamed protein product [Tuwongella immobilis]